MHAANAIESQPHLFDWSSCDVAGCGTPGCALGWIAAFRVGHHEGGAWSGESTVGVRSSEFYDRMRSVCPTDDENEWKRDAAICAHTLRLYAEKYHGHEKPAPRNFARELMAKCERQTVSTEAVSEELTW